MKKIYQPILLLLIMILLSCSKKLDYKEFTKYVQSPENGLKLTVKIQEVTMTAQYWPQELVVWQELKRVSAITDSIWLSTLSKYKKNHYIKVSLSVKEHELMSSVIEDRELYSNLVNKLSFDMQDYAYLIEQPVDTLFMVNSYVPRYYGVSNSTDVILIYNNNGDINSDLRLELNDLGIGTGDVSFVFNKKLLNSIPKLDYRHKN